MAIVSQCFPSWSSSTFNETYFLTSLLHDIGATPKNMPDTHMSFEFFGGIIALNTLRSFSSPTPQAESVAESIMRHQDAGNTGTLSRMGALTQLATIFDNMSWDSTKPLVAKETIEDVVKQFPRLKWSGCFAKIIRAEVGLKPWCHTTHLTEDFPRGVEGNEYMKTYD
jgi:cyanamide hydratase